MAHRPTRWTRRRFAAGFRRALAGLTLLVVPSAIAAAGAYTNTTLDGPFAAHDLFALLDGSGATANGIRRFEDGQQVSFVTFASQTPLSYAVQPTGSFRLFKTGSGAFDTGQTGSVALQGGMAILQRFAAANADTQVPEGYAALRLSLARPSGMNDADFDGEYAYAALLFTPAGIWRNVTGVVDANGAGSYTLTRSDASGTGPYSIDAKGQVALGTAPRGAATIDTSGDILLQTVDLLAGRDPLFPSGAKGLALYLRRMTAATDAGFRGTYRVHRITVRPGGNHRIDTGSITAGGAGVYFGTLGAAAYNGRIALAADGAFTLADDPTRTGALGLDGDLAVVWPPAGLVSGNSGQASLELWVRTAGGGPLPGDRDGDSLLDTEETTAGTSPTNPDSDGDGVLDNADATPNRADNLITATLSPATITLPVEDLTPPTVTLKLDTNDFPFFDWSITSTATWARVTPGSGSGDVTLPVTLDTRAFTVAGSPYTADLRLTAPAMRALSPIRLTVNVVRNLEPVTATPDTVAFTGVEGGLAPAPQPVLLTLSGTPNTPWTTKTDALWIKATPTQSTGNTTVSVAVDPAGLAARDTPYSGTLQIFTNLPDTPAATISVSFQVLPRRDFGVSFGFGVGNDIQYSPAAACSPETGRYAVAWAERDTIYGAAIDDLGGPRFPRTALSLPAVGIAAHPNVVVDRTRNNAWFIWEQQFGEAAETGLNARTLNLTTNTLGNPIGLAAAPGAMTQPKAVYHAAGDQLLVAYVLRTEALAEVRLLRYSLATRSVLGDAPVATTLSEATEPDLAVDPASDTVLVVWSEQRATSEDSYARVYTRLFRASTGTALGEAVRAPVSARFQRQPAVYIESNTGLFSLSWIETNTFSGVIGSLKATRVNGTTGLHTGPPAEISATAAPTGHTGLYAAAADQALLVWSDPATGDQGTYARVTPGSRFLGPATRLPYLGGPQYAPALAYHPVRNEFLAVWQDTGPLPAQIYAARLDGGSADNDSDGLPNVWELQYGLNPFSAEGDDGADGNPDDDGATNLQELAMGTDPRNPDTDGDALVDGQEDPNFNGVVDPGESSPLAADTDGDGADDAAEWFLGADANDPLSRPGTSLFRVAYGAWTPGQPGTLTLWLYAAQAGTYDLALNPAEGTPAGWNLPAPPLPLTLAAGTQSLNFTITPGAGLLPSQAVGDFRFQLSAAGVPASTLTARLVADPRTTTLPEELGTTPGALARRFAPIIRAHRDEFYPPVPVEATLSAAGLQPQGTAALPRPPSLRELFQIPQAEAALDLPGEDLDALRAAFTALGPQPATMYYTFAVLGAFSEEPVPEGGAYALQYYLHYFAGEWGYEHAGAHRHEGDWELVQVTLDATLNPVAVTATRRWANAQAGDALPGGESIAWADLTRDAETHPVIYTGRGGHTPYFAPGAHRVGNGLEEHDGLGTWYVPEEAANGEAATAYPDTAPLDLVPLGRMGEDTNPAWLRYAGRWGQRDFPALPEDATPGLRDGPVGPLFMGDAPNAEATTGVVNFWSDPNAWRIRTPVAPAVATTQITGTLPADFAAKTAVLLDAQGRRFTAPVDPVDFTFAFDVPVQHYSLVLVETGPLGVETYLAAASFPTGIPVQNLFPAQPDTTPLGTFTLFEGRLLGEAPYTTADQDNDGIPDRQDTDQDNDGLLNPLDPDALGDGWADSYQTQDPNRNGIPRYYDAITDPPPAEAAPDDNFPKAPGHDGFSTAPDLDDDGFSTAPGLDSFSTAPGFDDDGFPDAVEHDSFPDAPGHDSFSVAPDLDDDGFPDAVDLDWDNDTYPNDAEIAAGTNPRNFYDRPGQRAGDLDGNGELNSIDLQRLINIALRRDPTTPLADLNTDGQITAVDLQLLLDLVLNR